MSDEAAIRAIVVRLARPIASGGHTIERAAILAEGSACAEIEAWILREGGEPHVDAAGPRGRGLHADRTDARSASRPVAPSRYVLPASWP
jgi:hypothetical protein